MKTFFAGADGCRRGWAVAIMQPDGAFAPLDVVATFAELAQATALARLTLVDIPMGLLDGPGATERRCEREARQLLGPRRSSLFAVPVRAAVHAGSYAEACHLNQLATGKKLSIQTWGIVPKIAEADLVLRATSSPGLQGRVRECHPEVCFAALNGWQPLVASKKTPEGVAQRLALLAAHVPNAGDALNEARSRYKRADVATDDLLDAMVAAVSARLAAARGMPTVPPAPPQDRFGIPMAIVTPYPPGHIR